MSASRPVLTDTLLKDALSSRADVQYGHADLIDDVLIAVQSTSQRRNWGLPVESIGRPALILAAAALLLLGIVTGSLLTGASQLRRDPERILKDGALVAPFLGLPPRGAEPSEPETGELVLSDGGIHPWYHVNVYADGRLIWAREGGPLSDGVNSNTGWIEQRLTPYGIGLLRMGAVELGGQYEDPALRLPPGAWSDRTIRAYVPARFSACYWYLDDYESNPAEAFGAFPEEAQALLMNAIKTYYIYTDGQGRPGDLHCHNLTTADALTLDKILARHLIERPRIGFNSVDYALDDGVDRVGRPVDEGYGVPDGTPFLYVSPLLPHGEAIGAAG